MGGSEGVDTVHAVEARDRGRTGAPDDVDVEGCLVGVYAGLLLGAGTDGCGLVGGVGRLAQESVVLKR